MGYLDFRIGVAVAGELSARMTTIEAIGPDKQRSTGFPEHGCGFGAYHGMIRTTASSGDLQDITVFCG